MEGSLAPYTLWVPWMEPHVLLQFTSRALLKVCDVAGNPRLPCQRGCPAAWALCVMPGAVERAPLLFGRRESETVPGTNQLFKLPMPTSKASGFGQHGCPQATLRSVLSCEPGHPLIIGCVAAPLLLYRRKAHPDGS